MRSVVLAALGYALVCISGVAFAQTPGPSAQTPELSAPQTPAPSAQQMFPEGPLAALADGAATAPLVSETLDPVTPHVEGGFVAPPELVTALQRMRMPPTGRFAYTQITYDRRTKERRGLRFDPRREMYDRWSISEAPERANVRRVERRIERMLEPVANPDIMQFSETPSPEAMSFDGLVRESPEALVFGFRMIARIEEAERLEGLIRGEFEVDRVSGDPRRVSLFNTEHIRSGLARVDALRIDFELARIEGCCVLFVAKSESAAGSALFIPGTRTESERYEDIEYLPDLPRDGARGK